MNNIEEKTTFRPIRRTKNAISEEAAKDLLLKGKRGIFAVNGDNGYPFACPVDYFYDPEEGKIFFHGAKSGLKVDSLRKCDKVCFTVFGNDFYKEGDWAPYVQSTIAYGRCHLVEDAAETESRLRTLGLKYFPTPEDVEEEIAKDIKRAQLYEITIEHLTGKQIHEK